jgi:hypothetical protein
MLKLYKIEGFFIFCLPILIPKGVYMISYAPFWRLIEREQVSQYRLIQDHKVSAAQLHRLKKNLPVSTETIRQLCLLFSCNVSDIMEVRP